MSEDYDEDDELKPQPRSPLQQRIADLMYREGKSYDEAFEIVMGQQKPTKFDWYADQPTTPQPKPKPRQLSIENLEDLANSINAELEDVENKKASLKQNAMKFQEKKEKLVSIGKELLSNQQRFIEEQKQAEEREKLFNEYVADYNKKVEAFNEGMKKLKEMAEKEARKTHAYIKKISVTNKEEFKN
jgi:hypothetical protein